MRTTNKLRMLACVMGLLGPVAVALAAGGPAAWEIGLRGVGPVQFGMTVAEAEKAAGVKLKPLGSEADPACHYVAPSTGPDGVRFMVVDGHIRRADVIKPGVRTIGGLQVGDTEGAVLALLKKAPGKIVVERHKYDEDGLYLIYLSDESKDDKYRVLFETSKGKVTSYRAGLLPEIEWVEGCS